MAWLISTLEPGDGGKLFPTASFVTLERKLAEKLGEQPNKYNVQWLPIAESVEDAKVQQEIHIIEERIKAAEKSLALLKQKRHETGSTRPGR